MGSFSLKLKVAHTTLWLRFSLQCLIFRGSLFISVGKFCLFSARFPSYSYKISTNNISVKLCVQPIIEAVKVQKHAIVRC